MRHIGYLDRVDDLVLYGWAYDFETQTSPLLVVSVDDKIVGEFAGTDFRPDLAPAGIGDGHHAFAWPLPPDLDIKSLPLLTVRFASNGEVLRGGEVVLSEKTLAKSDLFGGILSHGLWAMDRVELSGQTVRVAGWAVPPFGMPYDFAITHNGVPLDFVENADRPDVADRIGLVGKHKRFGFRVETEHAREDASGTHELAFVDRRTGKPFNPHHTLHFLPVTTPIPNEARRRRVAGSENLASYLQVGATVLTRLDRVAMEYFGRSFSEADAILDWGCGCGRVLQYLSPEQRSHLTGIDIDADNIEWCRENFPEARFEVVLLEPPTALPPNGFDLIFSISVLTHLREQRQLEWLAELARIARPGAAVLLSVNGETAWLNIGRPINQYSLWRANGFLVDGKNTDLDDSGADSGDYYNSFISRRYIFENWSRYFKVLDVIAGAVNNHQDLVVLKKL